MSTEEIREWEFVYDPFTNHNIDVLIDMLMTAKYKYKHDVLYFTKDKDYKFRMHTHKDRDPC